MFPPPDPSLVEVSRVKKKKKQKKRKEIKIKNIHPASLGHLKVEAGMLFWSLFITAAQSVFRGALI